MPFSIADLNDRLSKSISHIQRDLGSLRTGRASAQLLDSVRVEAYGTLMGVHELANISVPDSSLIVITPWDKSLLASIEKGISSAALNLNPVVDGDLIRISIPPLTQERREEMVKLLKQKIEQGKVMVRNIRSEVKQEIESQEGSEGISEDDIKNDIDEMEAKIKSTIEKIDQLGEDKETELMTV